MGVLRGAGVGVCGLENSTTRIRIHINISMVPAQKGAPAVKLCSLKTAVVAFNSQP